MKLAVCCEKPESWKKKFRRFLKIYQESRVANLQVYWADGKREAAEMLKKGRYDIILIEPDIFGETYGSFARIMDSLCRHAGKEGRMYCWEFRKNAVFLREEEISHLYSSERKIYVSDGKRDYRIRGTISDEAKKLPEDQFVRIHRNCLVNLACVRAVEGNYILLKNGKRVEISIRRKRETIEKVKRYMSKCVENETGKKDGESTGPLDKKRLFC